MTITEEEVIAYRVRIRNLEAALREIAHGNWSNVKPDSQASSDLSQIVAEMQRIASEAIR